MESNQFNSEQLELLAAGYVLEDLDEAEMARVKQLIESSRVMREQIGQSLAVMANLVTEAPQIPPPIGLKEKVKAAFAKKTKTLSENKNIVNLANWFDEIFAEGWQVGSQLLGNNTIGPAFRNTGVAAGRKILIGGDRTVIVLMVRVIETSLLERDLVVEIFPELKDEYLPSGLKVTILDSDEDPVMEAIAREDNKNIKFEFSGTSREVFSIKLKLFNDVLKEDFIL